MNTHETVRRFAQRIPNPRKGNAVDWRGAVSYGYSPNGFTGARIYCDGNALYSYGGHFVLAHYLGDRDGKRSFLKNGDRASQTTSRQQAGVQELCLGPTVSFTAFAAAGVSLSNLGTESVIDFAEDNRAYLMREKDTGIFYRLGKWNGDLGQYEKGEVFTPPKQGAFFHDTSQPENDDFISGVWHVLAACLIHVEGRYLLSAVDEGSYFVSELPSPAASIGEAFTLLKPREVRKAEAKGATIQRQGEWFFIAMAINSDRELARLHNLRSIKPTIESLPRRRDAENCHRCFVIEQSGELWGRGTVRHQREMPRYVHGIQMSPTVNCDAFTYRSTREHAALKLGREWHRVYRNTELGAWTAARTRWSRGGVD